MITLENVSKKYPPNVVALDRINVRIKPGEFVSLVGQSGTGKTTLVRCLIGEERVSEGRVMIGDWDITRIGKHEVPYLRRQVAVIFQDFKLLPKKTLAENVAFALEVAGKPSEKIKSVVPRVMQIVGLASKMHRYPSQVSGGEQQRAAIARALVYQPKVLLADEPTGNLDSINAQEIIDLLQKINEFGTTIVLVTHNKDVVNRLKRRVVTLHDGRIISDRKVGTYML